MEQSSSRARPTFGHLVLAFALLVLLWLLLVGSLQHEEVIAALVVGSVVTAVSAPRLSIMSSIRLTPAAAVSLIRFLATFFPALVRANLDVARRVLSPSLPLDPAVVEVRTSLTSPLGKLLLANSITLTPGTLAVDVQGDRILVHWIDSAPGTDIESATSAISQSLERHISGFLR